MRLAIQTAPVDRGDLIMYETKMKIVRRNNVSRKLLKLEIGQCRLGVDGTCDQIRPWHLVRNLSSWVRNPGRPPSWVSSSEKK